MKILIVEDEKLLADSLKTLLESKGFDVETVYDGISGAVQLQGHRTAPGANQRIVRHSPI